MTGILHFYAMRNALYHLCLRSKRDESRPYGSRPVIYNMGNHVLGGCQRVAMRKRRGVIHHVPHNPNQVFLISPNNVIRCP